VVHDHAVLETEDVDLLHGNPASPIEGESQELIVYAVGLGGAADHHPIFLGNETLDDKVRIAFRAGEGPVEHVSIRSGPSAFVMQCFRGHELIDPVQVAPAHHLLDKSTRNSLVLLHRHTPTSSWGIIETFWSFRVRAPLIEQVSRRFVPIDSGGQR
jgi:hypothetical protein